MVSSNMVSDSHDQETVAAGVLGMIFTVVGIIKES